jgi:pimeloyl-ACP methyl ester carboxylesterase
MSGAPTQRKAREGLRCVPTIDGYSVAVGVSGPDFGPAVVMFANRPGFGACEAVCRRLHIAMFRTIVISADPRLNAKSVIGVLDTLKIRWALLVAGRIGGGLAWTLAATHPERFKGLVAINHGHPCVPDITGVICDSRCFPVEINTTMLVDTPARHNVARATSRYVYGEFRVAQLLDGRDAEDYTSQLAAEVVLRAYSW